MNVSGHSFVHMADGEDVQDDDTRPQLYLILCNISKSMNVGMFIRSACAFGAREVCVVGGRGAKDFSMFGSHGTAKHMRTRWFHKLRECVAYLKEKGMATCMHPILRRRELASFFTPSAWTITVRPGMARCVRSL